MDALTGMWVAAEAFVLLVLTGNYLVYKKLASVKNTSFKFAFAPVFLLCTAPFLVLSLPIFAIYRQIVNLVLTWIYGSKYWGLLEGRDAVYNLENKNPVQLLFIIKYPSNRSQNFYNAVKDATYSALKSSKNSKIFGAIRTFLGYSYIVKDEITFNNCFRTLRTMNLPISKDSLIGAMEEYTSVPLPKNREALWDMFVGTQPVNWTDDDENEVQHYPILVRINHSLGDGGHVLNGITKLFADKCDAHLYQGEKSPATDQQSLATSFLTFFVNWTKKLQYYVRQVYVMLLTPSVCLVNALLMIDELNVLHGPKMTHSKHLLVSFERSPYYIDLVKRIKKRIPGSTFEDVCLTAIAASFKEFFQKSSTPIPEYIVTEIPAVPLSLIKPEKPKAGDVCRNRLTFSVHRLPVNFNSNIDKPLTNVLQLIKKEKKLIRDSLEYEVNYFILRVVCHLIPALILRPTIEILHNYTALISNTPGPNLITVMGSCPIQDICAWVATRGYTGVGFTISTYDGRLELTLTVDKALVSDRNEVQGLLDGVHKSLHLLEDETR